MPDVSPAGEGVSLEAILTITGKQLAATIASTVAEAGAVIAQKDAEIAELRTKVDELAQQLAEAAEDASVFDDGVFDYTLRKPDRADPVRPDRVRVRQRLRGER